MAVHVAHKAPADLTLDANAHQRFHYDPVTGHITGFDGRVLDVEGGNRAEGAAVIYFDKAPHLSPNQQWDWDGQRAAFVSRMGTGFVLDAKGVTKPEEAKNGVELIVWRATGRDNQKWDIDPFGIYRSRANAAFCIDINGGKAGAASGVNKVSLWAAHVTAEVSAQIYKLRDAANQRWAYDAKSGYVTGFDGRVLDVEGDAKVKGAKVFAYDRRTEAASVNLNQQFDYKDGFFVSRASGLVLDVKGGKVENGTDLILWENNGGANQKWDIDANGFIRTHANTKFCLDLIGGPKPNKGAGTVKLYLSYL